jgi:hypothetical protein
MGECWERFKPSGEQNAVLLDNPLRVPMHLRDGTTTTQRRGSNLPCFPEQRDIGRLGVNRTMRRNGDDQYV